MKMINKNFKLNSNYIIFIDGRIYNQRTETLVKTRINNHGYEDVSLYVKGKNETFRVHRLIAEHFLPNPMNKRCVNHIDEDKTNNHVSNLEWCTHKENNNHGTRTNRQRKSISKTLHKKYYGKKRGVRFRNGKYNTRICVNRKDISLGTFDNINEAYEAYQRAYRVIFGRMPW